MSDDAETTGPKQRGRPWPRGTSGNPAGRPLGARHEALKALDAIGSEGAADVMRKVVEEAKGGDMRAAEILLRRLWPERKGRPVALDMPSTTDAASVAAALSSVTLAVAAGDLSPEEGQAVAAILETQRRAIETAELEARITALEERNPR
ncbi:hypothetical protein GXW78_06080 [Roseomonas terrae]|uniref:DUF5681 domain-containing protein n=1 Tax=Neoroseomonas terrae TaxID=424799 RepID=A0ABS5EDX4_9PROT|nr:DUF5681 domain-containing protein [Neoroseomonas terrae]MBR0649222.1 hypothetical protein [Neoroseomonas terrae]